MPLVRRPRAYLLLDIVSFKYYAPTVNVIFIFQYSHVHGDPIIVGSEGQDSRVPSLDMGHLQFTRIVEEDQSVARN